MEDAELKDSLWFNLLVTKLHGSTQSGKDHPLSSVTRFQILVYVSITRDIYENVCVAFICSPIQINSS